MENPNNQFTPLRHPNTPPFYKTTWFILLTTFCICFPVGLFLMWKYKKFHIGVRIALTSVLSLTLVISTAAAVVNAIGFSSTKASSSIYSTYSMETTANDLFETEEETTAKPTRSAIEETTWTVNYVDRSYANTIIIDFKEPDKNYSFNTITSYFYDTAEIAKADKVKVGDTVTLVGVCDGSIITIMLNDWTCCFLYSIYVIKCCLLLCILKIQCVILLIC